MVKKNSTITASVTRLPPQPLYCLLSCLKVAHVTNRTYHESRHPFLSGPHHAFQDLAKADTEVFEEESDGMFARVEAPSAALLRIWVCVKAWRLFEGLAHTTAVEALGLDPAKGVMVSGFRV